MVSQMSVPLLALLLPTVPMPPLPCLPTAQPCPAHPSPRAIRRTRMMRMMVGLIGRAALISISSSVMPMTDSNTMARSSWFHLLGHTAEDGRDQGSSPLLGYTLAVGSLPPSILPKDPLVGPDPHTPTAHWRANLAKQAPLASCWGLDVSYKPWAVCGTSGYASILAYFLCKGRPALCPQATKDPAEKS